MIIDRVDKNANIYLNSNEYETTKSILIRERIAHMKTNWIAEQ